MVLIVNENGVAVEFIRVAYDVEAARGILASELPNDFAEVLRTGGRPAVSVA